MRPGADRPDRRGSRPRYGERKGGYDRDRRNSKPYQSRSREGYSPREGYEKREGYAPREGYEKREGYTPREGYEKRDRYDRRGSYDRRRDDRRDRPHASGLPRSKRQPYFGTYLGNSNDLNRGTSEEKNPADPSREEE